MFALLLFISAASEPSIVANRDPGDEGGNWNAFYSVGFGPKARFAYVIRTSGEGATEDRWTLIIQNLVTDDVVAQLLSTEGEDLEALKLRSVPLLREHRISTQPANALWKFPIRHHEDELAIRLGRFKASECPPRTLPPRPVYLRSKKQGEKQIGTVKAMTRWIDCVPIRDAKAEGYFRQGRTSDRIAVVVSQEIHGFEGELTTVFQVFGASLSTGFR